MNDKLRVGSRLEEYGLFHEPVEELPPVPRRSAVEAECELVEVEIELLSRYRPLMGAQQPALQQGRHPMHPGQECHRRLPAPADHPGLVRVSLSLESLVSFPSIRDHYGSRLDRALYEAREASGGSVRNPAEADAPDPLSIDLRGDHHQSLISQASAAPPGLDSPDVRLVHFDLAGERVPTGSNHGAPELLEASPTRPITSEPEQPLQSKGADPVLLICEPPHGAEPSPQGKVAPVKDRSGRDGGLVSALAAHHERSFCSPSPDRSASGAAKPCWPAHLNQICTAGVLRRKPVLEFGEGVGVVLHDMKY